MSWPVIRLRTQSSACARRSRDSGPARSDLGIEADASIERLRFCGSVEETVEGADFVQENGPERLDFKRELFAALDAATPPHVVLASSSSGIPRVGVPDGWPASRAGAHRTSVQSAASHPAGRSGGRQAHVATGSERCDESRYRHGQETRSTSARSSRVSSPTGCRPRCGVRPMVWSRPAWVFGGRHRHGDLEWSRTPLVHTRSVATQHLSGGPGGLAHVLEHLGPPMDGHWQDLLPTRLTKEVVSAVLEGSKQATRDWDMDAVVRGAR